MKKYDAQLHRLAILTALVTFVLVFVGGVVTGTDSGLSVPDWPTTFGYNMFLYPLSKTVSGFLFSVDSSLQVHLDDGLFSLELRTALERSEILFSENVKIADVERGTRWRVTDVDYQRVYTLIGMDDGIKVYVHGVLYEHTHRLIGIVVGVLVTLFMVLVWARDSRKWMKWLSLVALFAVVLQGVMGGLRVEQISRFLAIVHACFAQVFFVLTASFVLFTSRNWWERQISGLDTSRLKPLSIMTVGFIYIQIVFGAVLRHTGSRLDAHLFFALLVAVHVFLLARKVKNDYSGNRALERPVLFLAGLLVLQLVLGLASFLLESTTLNTLVGATARALITTAHLAIGALMLVTSVMLVLKVFRTSALSETVINAGLVNEEVSV